LKILLSAVLAAAVATSIVSIDAAAQTRGAAAKSLVLESKSGPHSISLKSELVTFYFKIHGIKFSSKYPGKNVKGHGHIQIYLDSVPSDAYSKRDLKHLVSRNVPPKVGRYAYAVTIEFDDAWIKEFAGQHTLLIGLAKNNEVMYHAPVASFALSVTK
jgi:hypothetical protein